MWGFIINGIQSSALEWKGMKTVPWNGGISASLLPSLVPDTTKVVTPLLPPLDSWPPHGIYMRCVPPQNIPSASGWFSSQPCLSCTPSHRSSSEWHLRHTLIWACCPATFMGYCLASFYVNSAILLGANRCCRLIPLREQRGLLNLWLRLTRIY